MTHIVTRETVAAYFYMHRRLANNSGQQAAVRIGKTISSCIGSRRQEVLGSITPPCRAARDASTTYLRAFGAAWRAHFCRNNAAPCAVCYQAANMTALWHGDYRTAGDISSGALA